MKREKSVAYILNAHTPPPEAFAVHVLGMLAFIWCGLVTLLAIIRVVVVLCNRYETTGRENESQKLSAYVGFVDVVVVVGRVSNTGRANRTSGPM